MIPEEYFLHEHYLEPPLNQTQFYRFATKKTDLSNKSHLVEKSFIREVEITYLGRKKELLIFDVFTSNIVFDSNQNIANKRLSLESAYIFYDLEIGVNNTGEIVEIFNLNEIENHWKSTKLELQKDNLGYELDIFFETISNILKEKEKVISFLNSRKMFGLYFNGLFGKNDLNQAPRKQKTTVAEFDNIILLEEIYIKKNIAQFLITAQKSDDEHQNIIPDSNKIKKYKGEWYYTKNNQLEEGFFEIENENMNIKYDALWVG